MKHIQNSVVYRSVTPTLSGSGFLFCGCNYSDGISIPNGLIGAGDIPTDTITSMKTVKQVDDIITAKQVSGALSLAIGRDGAEIKLIIFDTKLSIVGINDLKELTGLDTAIDFYTVPGKGKSLVVYLVGNIGVQCAVVKLTLIKRTLIDPEVFLLDDIPFGRFDPNTIVFYDGIPHICGSGAHSATGISKANIGALICIEDFNARKWSIICPEKSHSDSHRHSFVKCTVIADRIVILANAINVILGKSRLFEYNVNENIFKLSVAKHPLLSLQCAASDDKYMFVGGMINTDGVNVGYTGLVCGNISICDIIPKSHIPVDIAVCGESCVMLSRGVELIDDIELIDISGITTSPISSFFKSYTDDSMVLIDSEQEYIRVNSNSK